MQSLVDTAYANRNDLKFSENKLALNFQNLALQKAMAVPDLTVGITYDKRGGYVDNSMIFSLTMDLPFFSRNQGNIKAARISIDQSKTVFQQQKLSVENEVQLAYVKVLNTEKILQSIDPDFKNESKNYWPALLKILKIKISA